MKVKNRRNECKDSIYINQLQMKAPPEDRENEMIAYLKIKEKIGIKFFGGYKEVVRVCLV